MCHPVRHGRFRWLRRVGFGTSFLTIASWLSATGTAVAQDAAIDWQQSEFTQVLASGDESATEVPPPFDPEADPIPPAPPADRFLEPTPASPATNPVQDESAVDNEAEADADDPFSRPPGKYLRSLSEVRVSLDTPTTGQTRADEVFEERGVLTLAPHAWPNQTPEAAACHFASGPLWYEDANLERCGYTHCCAIQPVVSGAHFLTTTALLPYHFAAAPPCEANPTRGFCPPGCRYGFCDNYLPDPDLAGGTAQALALTGLIFLIP